MRAAIAFRARSGKADDAGSALVLAEAGIAGMSHAGPTTALPSGTDEVDNATVTRLVCARLERRGGATKLIVPAGAGDARPPSPNSAMIKALVRAQHWLDQLQSGQAAGMRAIARAEGLTDRYVARILPLAFLAPDIKEAILRGTQPVDLTLDQLCRSLPLVWFEQRQVLGFHWPQGCHEFPAATSHLWHGRPAPRLTQDLQVHEP